MKLTIVHPAIGKVPGRAYMRGWQMEPLPAAYLAGLTGGAAEITFFDDRMEDINFDAPTDLVAISVETYTAKRAYQIASEFRRRGIPVVMGGFHPTLCPDEVMDYAEAVVVGEAEGLWSKVLTDFKNGHLQRLYKSDGRPDIRFTKPDRSIFNGKKYLPLGLVEAGRGCVFKCDFCVIQSYFNSTQNRRDTSTIIAEILEVKQRSKVIFFVDDNIVSHPNQAKAFYEALIPLKIRWVSQATITMTYDDEMLKLLKASGCEGVLIGLESLDPQTLKSMNKSFNLAGGGPDEAVKRLHQHGIRLYATFMFGYDTDTLDSFRIALEFSLRHKIFMVAFNHLTPFPGTPLYERLQSQGRLLYDKWWLDDDYKYGQVPFKTTLAPEVIQRECVKARAAFYSYRSILRRLFHPTNGGDLSLIFMYLFINTLLRKEVYQRDEFPLGDIGFKGPLLKVGSSISQVAA